MALAVTGELVNVLPEQSGESARGSWKKCSFIIKTQEQYPKNISIEAWGDKVDDLKNYKQGDLINVHINIESREFNGKWYTNVRMWKMENASAMDNGAPQQFQNEGQPSQPEVSTQQAPPADVTEDLPF